jgi:hypothetical protein
MTSPNKGMKLTKLSAAPTLAPQAALSRRCRLMPAKVATAAGTASQLIPRVRRTRGGAASSRSRRTNRPAGVSLRTTAGSGLQISHQGAKRNVEFGLGSGTFVNHDWTTPPAGESQEHLLGRPADSRVSLSVPHEFGSKKPEVVRVSS